MLVLQLKNQEVNVYVRLREGDALTYQLHRKFSTRDRDNDACRSCHCARKYKAAWWHNVCSESNLNGLHLRGNLTNRAVGIEWEPWRGFDYSLKFSEMKLKPYYT